MKVTISKYIYMLLSEFSFGLMGLIGTYFAFNSLGFIAGVLALVITLAGAFGILAFYFFRVVPVEEFFNSVWELGTPMPKMVIIKDAKHPDLVWFKEMGELVMTNMGGFFFYGHPFFGQRKILLINSLRSEEAIPQFIVINGVPRFKDKILYVETEHPVIIKGKPATYEDLIEQKTGADIIIQMADNVRKAVGGNINFIKEKTDKMRLDEFGVGEV